MIWPAVCFPDPDPESDPDPDLGLDLTPTPDLTLTPDPGCEDVEETEIKFTKAMIWPAVCIPDSDPNSDPNSDPDPVVKITLTPKLPLS